MAAYEIIGGQPLRGEVTTPGSKNAVLPLLAATVLFDAPVTLTNVPDINDVDVMLAILEKLGKQTARELTTVTVTPNRPINSEIPADLARRIRTSLLFLGPILARTGKISMPQPGGDLIGKRPFDYHVNALSVMGANFREDNESTTGAGELHGADIYLEEPTVTGTENLLMAACLAHGQTTIRNAAQEQHVYALSAFLSQAGAEIEGLGTSTVTVTGRKGEPFSKPITFAVPSDELDAGTFAIAALVTNGAITIRRFPVIPLRPLTEKLIRLGASIRQIDESTVHIERAGELQNFKLRVGFAPGFPTDLQPPMAVLASLAQGVSLIHDWIYERRFGYADELSKMGANITMCDPHRILIVGPSRLVGRHIYSLDIRAGIAFVLAALAAEGQSTIDHADIVERGYEHLETRLTGLGARITRKDI